MPLGSERSFESTKFPLGSKDLSLHENYVAWQRIRSKRRLLSGAVDRCVPS